MDDINNPRKYLIYGENFQDLPRWPNDGIEQFKKMNEIRVDVTKIPYISPAASNSRIAWRLAV
jgi:hypothetical protein